MPLDPVTASSVVGAGGGLVQTLIQNAQANKNLQFQKDVQSYEKDIQQKAWAREDNAVQRRVADLRAAGLSPVLAAGSSASSSSPIRVSTPQRDYTDTKPISQGILDAMNLMRQKAEISNVQSQGALLAKQAEKQDLENKLLKRDVDLIETYNSTGHPSGLSRMFLDLAGYLKMYKNPANLKDFTLPTLKQTSESLEPFGRAILDNVYQIPKMYFQNLWNGFWKKK